MTKKAATKAKMIDPRDQVIDEQRKKIEVLIDRCLRLESLEKAACGTPRPSFSVGMSIDAPTLIVDNNGSSWWINPHSMEIRAA